MINTVRFQGTLKNITERGEGERKILTGTVSQYAGVSPTGSPRCNAFVNFVAFDEKAKAMLRGLVDIQESKPEVIVEGQLSYYRTKDNDVRQQVIISSIHLAMVE